MLSNAEHLGAGSQHPWKDGNDSHMHC